MSAGNERVPETKHPQRISMREWLLFVCALTGLLLVKLSAIAGGGWAGFAISGKASGAVVGGGIGLLIFVLVLDLVLLKQSAIERGCVLIFLAVLVGAAYIAAKRYEETKEQQTAMLCNRHAVEEGMSEVGGNV